MPLTTETIEYLEELVEDHYRHGLPFTSLDIANQAKQAGHFARNRWVAEWLRGNAINLAYAMGALFNQTLIEVDSSTDGHTLAYLYHHMNFDPDDYLDRDQVPVSTTGGGQQKSAVYQATRGAFSSQDGGQHSPGTVQQHQQAVADKTGKTSTTATTPSTTAQGVLRDRYGRFASNQQDVAAGNAHPPTHQKTQKRDSKGRYVK